MNGELISLNNKVREMMNDKKKLSNDISRITGEILLVRSQLQMCTVYINVKEYELQQLKEMELEIELCSRKNYILNHPLVYDQVNIMNAILAIAIFIVQGIKYPSQVAS